MEIIIILLIILVLLKSKNEFFGSGCGTYDPSTADGGSCGSYPTQELCGTCGTDAPHVEGFGCGDCGSDAPHTTNELCGECGTDAPHVEGFAHSKKSKSDFCKNHKDDHYHCSDKNPCKKGECFKGKCYMIVPKK